MRTVSFLVIAAAIIGISLVAKAKENRITGSISTVGLNPKAYAQAAKIKMSQAIKAAEEAAHGEALSAALENEDGFLVFEVDVSLNEAASYEFLVDAGNGKILSKQPKGAFAVKGSAYKDKDGANDEND